MSYARSVALSVALAVTTPAMAMPPEMTPQALFDLCRSRSVASAEKRGEGLGWQRVAEDESWRRSFENFHEGSTVQSVGWRRDASEGSGRLSFWVARGATAFRACAYSRRGDVGLRAALTARFGEPSSTDDLTVSRTVYWQNGRSRVDFSEVGSGPNALVAVQITDME